MATTRKYDNGASGWTDYDSGGKAVASGTYNAPGTERNPYNADPNNKTGAGVNSGEGSLWNNATGQKAMKVSSPSSSRIASSSTSSPYQDQLTALKQAQLSAAMAGLDKQKNNSLSNLTGELGKIEPTYQKAKTGAIVTAKQTARSFDEYMAQRGGGIAGNNKSGIAGQGVLMNNLGYQGAKGTLDANEASEISDNARRVTDVGNAYNSDVQGASAGIEAQYLQNYIAQMNQDRSFGLQQQQMNNQVDQFGQSLGLQREQVDYGKSRDLVGDARYATETEYNQGRNTLADSRYADETQYNRSQAEMEWEFKRQGYSDDQAYRMATLAIDQQNANRLSSGGSSGGSGGGSKAITQSSATGKANNDDAIIEAQRQIQNGVSPGNVANSIEQQRDSLKRQGVNVDALIKAVWEMSGIQTRPEVEDSWR